MNTFDILDRPIAFHRVFVTLTGSVTAALMLSQAIYWTRRTSDEEGWFWKTQDEWEKETGLTRYEQEAARERLRALGFWKEERKGMPSKLYFRVDELALNAAFTVCGKTTYKNAEKPHTSMRKSSKQVCGKVADRTIYTESTSETTTKTTKNHHHQASSLPTIQNDDDDGFNSENSVLISPHLKLAEMIAEMMPTWTGSKTFLRTLNETQQIAAASWLYLWFICEMPRSDYDGQSSQTADRNQYKAYPFAKVDNIVGKIITQARAGNVAPLSAEHGEAFTTEIKSIFDEMREPA